MPPALRRSLRAGAEDSDLVAERAGHHGRSGARSRSRRTSRTTCRPGRRSRTRSPSLQPEKPIEKIELPPGPESRAGRGDATAQSRSKSRKRKSRSRSMRALRACRARPISRPTKPPHRCRGPRRATLMRRRTGRRSSWPRLSARKRYPSEARGDQGTAQLAFNVDRQGGVHNARVTRSSGSSVLDHEALALVQRAQPLPPPPPEIPAGAKFRSLCRSATTRAEPSPPSGQMPNVRFTPKSRHVRCN